MPLISVPLVKASTRGGDRSKFRVRVARRIDVRRKEESTKAKLVQRRGTGKSIVGRLIMRHLRDLSGDPITGRSILGN